MTRAELIELLDAEVEPYGSDILTILCNAGYVVVPKEPTERMLDACKSVQIVIHFPRTDPYLSNPEQCYRAMIAASQEDAE
jgi:hypothetical protein